ncbi:MAG: gliding motility-associated ABC transporter substrate-binding protein GldG [Gammaproteobacteria bacterium]|nr:gliding motility-associated ABC transporter substrate-binding protein GldG [Gammaproteobacteria bacterium]
MKPQQVKRNNIVQLALLLAIIVLVNVIGSFVFTRLDLTEDKRFTLSDTTIELLESLNSVVFVKVYLEGDFPPEFKRMRDATQEILDEMRSYAGVNLEYEFIDPNLEDENQKRELFQQLSDRGIQPSQIQETTGEGSSQQVIFPGALINFKEQESAVLLLQSKLGESTQQTLNNSIQSLEYGFANVIKKLSNPIPSTIGIIEGHGELEQIDIGDLANTLQETYAVQRNAINQQLKELDDYKLIIIAKPYQRFEERDKFIIDQFIMRGGRVLWMVDGTQVSMDSLQSSDMTVAISNDINIQDMLFKYGARVNMNLVQDLKAAPIPIVTGYVGNQPQQSLKPWYFFPLLDPKTGNKHPIVNNLNLIRAQFASTIDTVGRNADIKKTVLLTTSGQSRKQNVPVRVDLNLMRDEPNPRNYNAGPQPVAVLLEGNFTSAYKNTEYEVAIKRDTILKFIDTSEDTKMIVIGDGDIARNFVKRSSQQIFPLGYDRYTNQFFGNKNFILNAVDYLLDDSGLIGVRNKEFKLRLLDMPKITSEKKTWQILNVVVPLLLILILTSIKMVLRKRTFSKMN